MSDNYEVTASGGTCTSWAFSVQNAISQAAQTGVLQMTNGGGPKHEKSTETKKGKEAPKEPKDSQK
jgi:hypothetical protein